MPPPPLSSKSTTSQASRDMSSTLQPTPEDKWDPTLFNKYGSFTYSEAHTTPILGLLNAQKGEKILDVGCKTGEVTIKLQDAVGEQGVVVGCDLSKNMVTKAKENGVQLAFVSDPQALSFPPDLEPYVGKFDAVFSNGTLHWCKEDPSGVIQGVKRALRKDGGGRFVGEMGGYMNATGMRICIHAVLKRRGYDPKAMDSLFYPTAEQYSRLLEKEGFKVLHTSVTTIIAPQPCTTKEFLAPGRGVLFGSLSDAEAEEVISEIAEMYEVDGLDESGKMAVMFVRLRFVAVLPA